MSSATLPSQRLQPTPNPIPQLRSYPSSSTRRPSHPPWRTGQSQAVPAHGPEMIGKEEELSAGTRGVLKTMIRSSKLSSSQQRYLDQLLFQAGPTPLPAKPTPGLSFRPSQAGQSQRYLPPPPMPTMKYRPTRPQIRTLDQIVRGGAFDVDEFRPTCKKNYQDEKIRFQNLMATHGQTQADHVAQAAETDAPSPEPSELDEFDIVVREIEDRRQWLDDMVAMGHGEKYRREIGTEIGAVRLVLLWY
ncbi:hypothetical protein DFS34DRAFT_611242 [Phlyctochytrium arcticum]|nr:hypothetical protein DFS34DRAFT_611242 [Phlyctochytrium arcticum]